MKNVLFVFDKTDSSYAILPYFLKYKVNSSTTFVNNPWYVGDVDSSTINGNFSFNYQGIIIDIKFLNNLNFNNPDNINKLKSLINTTNYDKIFILQKFDNIVNNTINIKNLEILYFKVDENYHKTDDEIKTFLSKNRILSSASISFEHDNFYFEPTINLFALYYMLGLDYIAYKPIDVIKQNLMGMYYLPKYKNVRDKFYNIIKNIFESSELELPVIYDTNLDKPKIISQFLENNYGHWQRNHISTYLDYITSVCGFVFDTLNHESMEGPSDGTHRFYINEKSLKAILFSKLNIPFIIDTNPYNFKLLNELGFWFLNSEFHNFDFEKNEQNLKEDMKHSLIKSIEYLISIYKENENDLNKTHKVLVNKFESKMQNNYNTFIKYLSEPKDGDKLLNFILYGRGN